MGSKDDDDNVSCVTSSSKLTHDTETLSKNERELLHLPILFAQLVNNGDFSQVHQFILKYFTEDCLFQSPTMDAPAYGIQHVISTAKGIMQNMPDFMISATNIRLMNDEEIDGSTVPPRRCIVFDRNLLGKFNNHTNILPFPDHQQSLSCCHSFFPLVGTNVFPYASTDSYHNYGKLDQLLDPSQDNDEQRTIIKQIKDKSTSYAMSATGTIRWVLDKKSNKISEFHSHYKYSSIKVVKL